MTLKAAICPSCGGALQVADDHSDVKCLYCGVDVLVHEDSRSDAGRIKEPATVKPVKSTSPVSGLAKVLVGCGAVSLLFSIALLAQANYTTYGGLIMVIALVLIMTGISNL
jgi:hypothetical protein